MMVLAVPDGLSAVAAMQEFRPDLVMLDVNMPGLNGFEACERLRQLDLPAEFPIIMVTGEDDQAGVARAYAAGASYFLLKPISWPLLSHHIQYFLRAASVAARLRESTERASIIFETAAQAIGLFDLQNLSITDVNPAFCQMLGYSRDALLAMSLTSICNHQATAEHCKRLNETEVGTIETIEVKRADGNLLNVSVTHNRLHLDGRQLIAAFFTDVTAKRLAEALLMQRASHDQLTGLANRQLLNERLTQAIKHAARRQGEIALLFIDLDHFKPVNDTHGHAAGDQLLQMAAARLLTEVREEDTVARLGGDEFVVLLPMPAPTASSAARHLAQRLLNQLETPFELEAGTVAISASLGIALYPQHGSSADDLLEAADKALYRVKAGGRACFSFAS